jgi:hypothetical protein
VVSDGIEGLYFETHNWGRSVAFWQQLGYTLEFETDHNSGRLRHPRGGPYVFVAERPEAHELLDFPIIGAADPDGFEPPRSGEVERPFERTHWGVTEMLLRDPDGRRVSVQIPVADAPAGAASKEH